jgi:hypothetical protein
VTGFPLSCFALSFFVFVGGGGGGGGGFLGGLSFGLLPLLII